MLALITRMVMGVKRLMAVYLKQSPKQSSQMLTTQHTNYCCGTTGAAAQSTKSGSRQLNTPTRQRARYVTRPADWASLQQVPALMLDLHREVERLQSKQGKSRVSSVQRSDPKELAKPRPAEQREVQDSRNQERVKDD
jgi:hypothetical protein